MNRRQNPLVQVLQPFIPLLRRQRLELSEEARTNKAYHFGDKSFYYVPTLTGHVPSSKPKADES